MKTSTVIDLDLIRREVTSVEIDKQNLYHDLDYLNTNIHIPVLAKLKKRLDNPRARDNNAILREEFEADLYKVLEEWAYRDSKTLSSGMGYTGTYGVSDKYKEVKDEKSKKEFIDYCADMLTPRSREPWTHWQVEKIAAIALRSLIGGKSPAQTGNELDNAFEAYKESNIEQCAKDIKRDGVVIDLGGTPMVIFNPDDLVAESFPELTGEQIGFVKTLYHQGMFMGGALTTAVSAELLKDANKPDAFMPRGKSKRISICIRKDDQGKVYALSTTSYNKMSDMMAATFEGVEVEEHKLTQVSMTTDITALVGNDFTPACGSGSVSTNILMTGSDEMLASFALPPSIQRKPDNIDNDLEDCVNSLLPVKEAFSAKTLSEEGVAGAVYSADQKALVEAGEKELNTRRKAASSFKILSARENAVNKLTEYFTSQLKFETAIGSEQVEAMKARVVKLLKPLTDGDKVKEEALKNTAGVMVRDCVSIASSDDPTIKLSLRQRIHHVVIDGLKSLFGMSKAKKEFKDIISKDFVMSLKGGLKIDSSKYDGSLLQKNNRSSTRSL